MASNSAHFDLSREPIVADKRESHVRRVIREGTLCLRMLYSPRQVFAVVVPRTTWAIPILLLFLFALILGGADILYALKEVSQGAHSLTVEMQSMLFTRTVGVLGIIAIGLPLVLLLRSAFAAFLIRTVSAAFGDSLGYRQMLTISTYALIPMLVQFIVAFIGSHAHLFSVAQFSALQSLPSLTTRFGLDSLFHALGYQLNYSEASALNLVNPFECWKYSLIFLGLRQFGLRPFKAFAATLTSWLAEALIVYGLFSSLS